MANIIPSYYDFREMLASPGDSWRVKASSFGFGGLGDGGGNKASAAPVAPTSKLEPIAAPSSAPSPSGSALWSPATAPLTTPAASPATNPPVSLPQSYASYFAPLGEDISRLQESLSGAQQQFQEEAGPSRTFEGLGGTQALEQAITTGEGMEPAREMVDAFYTGPTQLTSDTLPGDIANLENWVAALRTTPGAMDLVQQQATGLTPGEARFEARHLLQTPDYLQSLGELGTAQKQLSSQFGQATQQAETYAAQRKAEEDAIAQLAQEYLRGRETGLDTELQAQLTQAQGTEAQAQELWDRYQAGDWGALEELERLTNPEGAQAWTQWDTSRQEVLENPEYRVIKDLPEMQKSEEPGAGYKWDDEWWSQNEKRFSKKQWKAYKELAHKRQKELDALGTEPESALAVSGDYKRYEDAQAKYDEVLGKYDAIKDIPLLGPGVSSKGRTKYVIPDPETGKSVELSKYLKQRGYSDKEVKTLREQVRARQRELEGYFGDVIDPRAKKWRWKEYKKGKELPPHYKGALYEGEYRDVLPMYGGTDRLAALPDPQGYLYFQPTVQPSIHNVSTEEQRDQFNRINELLGEADRLAETDPWQASQVSAGIDEYLEAEEQALEARAGQLDERRAEWLKQVKRARSKYKSTSATIERGLRSAWGNLGYDYLLPAAFVLDPSITTHPFATAQFLTDKEKKPGLGTFEPTAASMNFRNA